MSTTNITGRNPETGRTLSLSIDGGFISRVQDIDFDTDIYLSPGFVDLQVNGYAGFDLNADSISPATVVGLVQEMLTIGVTCFAPTLITASEEKLCRGLKLIAEARKLHARAAACIPFVHIEGPAISLFDGYRGAHEANHVRPPSLTEFDRWQQAAGGIVGLVTLSPHFDQSTDYIAALVKRGVHVAIGHTHASPEQIERAVNAGARLSTHLGNGIAEQISRHHNPIWSQLADDRLTASFIADGHHLPPGVLKAMLRAKGISRTILVSDSVALAGMPSGIYSAAVGGQVELHSSGKLCGLDSDYLAGSTASLAKCIGNVVQLAGVPLADAIRMATANPGKFAGDRGSLSLGSRADLVQFRWRGSLEVKDVWLAGEHVCKSK